MNILSELLDRIKNQDGSVGLVTDIRGRTTGGPRFISVEGQGILSFLHRIQRGSEEFLASFQWSTSLFIEPRKTRMLSNPITFT
jgi:hypothetical protein